MISIIVATMFLLVAVGILFYMIFGIKFSGNNVRFRKYYIALASVYLSAVFIVWIVSIIGNEIPLIFVIMSGISVSFVFGVSIITVRTLMRNMEEIRSELNARRDGEKVSDEKSN